MLKFNSEISKNNFESGCEILHTARKLPNYQRDGWRFIIFALCRLSGWKNTILRLKNGRKSRNFRISEKLIYKIASSPPIPSKVLMNDEDSQNYRIEQKREHDFFEHRNFELLVMKESFTNPIVCAIDPWNQRKDSDTRFFGFPSRGAIPGR